MDPVLTSRRLLLGLAGVLLVPSLARAAGADHAPAMTPAAALARMLAGNARYVAARLEHPDQGAARRREVATVQHPFATVLACADSRVPPELLFDQGLGDLFVIRVAGNVVDEAVLASIEYSVIHTGSPLVMVLGHERCGAVTATIAALDGHASDEDRDTHIGALATLIAPAVRAVPANARDPVDAAVTLNARRAATAILTDSRPIAERVRAGALRVVSARYDLDDGAVTEVQDAAA